MSAAFQASLSAWLGPVFDQTFMEAGVPGRARVTIMPVMNLWLCGTLEGVEG
jgi:hypothetical protein